MSTKVQKYTALALFISGGEQGWSERYAFGDITLTDALVNAAIICNWRAAIMPGGFRLKWAQVHSTDAPRSAKAVINSPLPNLFDGDEADAEDRGFFTVNETHDALHLRFESLEGKWGNRLIRGISDPQIVDDEAADAWPTATDPLLDAVPAIVATTGPTYIQYVRDFAEHVRLKTKIVSRIPPDENGNIYELFDIEKVVLRGITTRATGRPFGQSRGARPARIR